MSYCRFTKTNLVYMYGIWDYDADEHWIECCACRLTPKRQPIGEFDIDGRWKQTGRAMWWSIRKFKTRSGAMQHLIDHGVVGHLAAWDAYDRLEAEKVLFGNDVNITPWDYET